MSEYKALLQKYDFPACVKEALPVIETLIRNKQEVAIEIISEFIFAENRTNKRHSIDLSLIEEFQIVVALCDFFAKPTPAAESRNMIIFMALFGTITSTRISILAKLISTAISCSLCPILSASAGWMQQLGNSAPCVELAKCLVQDFVVFSKATEQFKSLTMVAPFFAANFMAAVADLYLNTAQDKLVTPPDLLLVTFTEWLSENPALSICQQNYALAPGAIAMPVVTPLAGLIRWCVLTPLFKEEKDDNYSKLNLALLQSIMAANNTTILNAQTLCYIAIQLKNRIEYLIIEEKRLESDEAIQLSLERFAQALQIALVSRCVYGHIQQLMNLLESLPHNGLLLIVIKTHKTH